MALVTSLLCISVKSATFFELVRYSGDCRVQDGLRYKWLTSLEGLCLALVFRTLVFYIIIWIQSPAALGVERGDSSGGKKRQKETIRNDFVILLTNYCSWLTF